MPGGLGYARALALDQETSAAIDELPEEQHDDARKLVHYSSVIGNTIPNAMTNLLLLTIPTLLLYFWVSLPLAIAFVVVAVPVTVIYAALTHQRLKREVNALVSSNPRYWQPIQKALEAAVLRAGERFGPMGPRITRT